MSRYNVYAIGQTVLMEAYNTDAEGQPDTPVDPQILLKTPDGTETSLTVTEDPVGHIYHEHVALASGRYFYRIVTADDVIERFFAVVPTPFVEPMGEPP